MIFKMSGNPIVHIINLSYFIICDINNILITHFVVLQGMIFVRYDNERKYTKYMSIKPYQTDIFVKP